MSNVKMKFQSNIIYLTITKMKKRKICVSRILKMTSLFFLSCAMFAQAETESSQSIRITLNKNNVRLENILNDIESQTNSFTIRT